MGNDRRALLLGLAAILLWSTVATAFKLTLRHLDLLQMLAWAALGSALTLMLCCLLTGRGHLLGRYMRESPGYFLLMGVTNPVIYYLVLFRAYELLPAQQAQTINYTWAITLALLSVPLLGQKLSGRDLLATALAYGGVVLIATRGQLATLAFASVEGLLYALLSTVIWALYWIVSTRNQRDPVASLCLNFCLAAPLAMSLCVLFSSPWPLPWQGLAGAAYIGLFEMGITFVLWSSALRLSSSVSRIGNLIFLSPLLSLVLIATVLGEAIHPATLAGLALIIPAILLQQRQSPRAGGALRASE